MIAHNSLLKMPVKRGTRFASRNDCRFYNFPKGDGFKTVLRYDITVKILKHFYFAFILHSPEVKTKKSSTKSSKKKSDDVNTSLPESDHFFRDEDYEEEKSAPIDPTGSESPRTSALRAMGGEAAQGVIEIMQQGGGEQVTYDAPYEGLTTISEENELEKSQQLSVAPSITITQVCVSRTFVKKFITPMSGI